MEPGSGQNRRDMRRGFDVGAGRKALAFGQSGILFRVELLHHAKAAKFAFDAVEITVVIGVARDEAITADAVKGLYTLNDMNGKRNPGYPGSSGHLVRKMEPGGRRVMNMRLGAQVVDNPGEQMRLLPAHEIDVTQRPSACGGNWG